MSFSGLLRNLSEATRSNSMSKVDFHVGLEVRQPSNLQHLMPFNSLQ